MDKNAIKKFATWARSDLIFRVSQKAAYYGVTAGKMIDAGQDYIDGRILSATEKKQRDALVKLVKDKGFEEAMEEVAYTWFNRFTALRYMDVNNYLPSHVRVFTDSEGKFRPQILDEAIHLNLPGLDMNVVYDLKSKGDPNALYRYLLIVQCNALNEIMPVMFQKIADYTELLFPDNLLREDSVLGQMITSIPEGDWTDQVQIIGWLYQYYNAEKKDEVFADLKKNIKVSEETLPAATQTFTPDWIVRYMVENSLGRLWTEGHPQSKVKSNWKYYLEGAEQEEDVKRQLDKIRAEYSKLSPEDITCIDPCSGSGHILVYMFDVLMQIYKDCGYTVASAVRSILENNLYGLDIDDRAAQLSYFSVMMKARGYDEDFFEHAVQPHVYAICGSNSIEGDVAIYFMSSSQDIKDNFISLMEQLTDAKERGALIKVINIKFDILYARLEEVKKEVSIFSDAVINQIFPLIRVGELLSQKYHITVTNPPYMGSGNMSTMLAEFTRKAFPDSKNDLSTAFMDRAMQMCERNGYMAMINIPAWMSLSSYKNLREKLIINSTIVNMVHPGRGIFGSDFGTTAFVLCNSNIEKYEGTYFRLFDRQGEVKTYDEREQAFLSGKGKYAIQQCDFSVIPGTPIAYWMNKRIGRIFSEGQNINSIGSSKSGMQTGNNELFLRFWYEVRYNSIGFNNENENQCVARGCKWIPQPKGGPYKKWYGNLEYVVNYKNRGQALRDYTGVSIIKNPQYYFKEGISWSHTTFKAFSARYLPSGCIFNVEAPSFYPNKNTNLMYILGLLNSKVLDLLFGYISQTLHYMAGDMAKIPVIFTEQQIEKKITELVSENVSLSKTDWDSFETSWDFLRNPLIQPLSTLAQAFFVWETSCNTRFSRLKFNEEELNRIFIKIYGLQDELDYEVDDEDITVCQADLHRDVRSLISYAVGCMFGRYSLDTEGIAYAGGEWDNTNYVTFIPDKVNIIPITDDEYFEDDIVNRFVDFVRIVYGKDTLEENLQFIADALGGTGTSREIIRNYFLNDFFSDHCRIYQRRPIYWLFESNRKSTFKCLIYMHRYKRDTIARIRTDYVHEQQSRYNTAIEDLESQINKNPANVAVLKKRLDGLKAQAEDLRMYEEKIHHLADQYIEIDLDDGVVVNYAKFKDVLAVIK